MKTRMQVAVKALVVNEDGDVLLLRRSSGDTFGADAWDTPGGKIRFGESVEDALRREVFEETGIKDFRVIKILKAWSLLKDEFTQLVGITFLCEYGNDEIRLSHEHAGYEWVSPSQVLAGNTASPSLQGSLRAFVDDCAPMSTSETQARGRSERRYGRRRRTAAAGSPANDQPGWAIRVGYPGSNPARE